MRLTSGQLQNTLSNDAMKYGRDHGSAQEASSKNPILTLNDPRYRDRIRYNFLTTCFHALLYTLLKVDVCKKQIARTREHEYKAYQVPDTYHKIGVRVCMHVLQGLRFAH